MDKLKQTLRSRKFLLAIGSALLGAVGMYLGIPEEKIALLAAPLLTWVVGEFALDAKAIDANKAIQSAALYVESDKARFAAEEAKAGAAKVAASEAAAITDAKSATAAFDTIGKTE